jgi:hypothetical protein
MPRATNNIEDLDHHDLTTCPGGFVKLRKMSYGQYLKRQGMAMEMRMEMASKGKAGSVDIDLAQAKVTEFEFGICVAEHNLEDNEGRTLDFRRPVDVNILDPRIGQEIGDLINAANTYDTEQVGN